MRWWPGLRLPSGRFAVTQEGCMRRWILMVEDEAAYNDAETIKTKFRKAPQIPDEDLVVVTMSMSVTLIETEDD